MPKKTLEVTLKLFVDAEVPDGIGHGDDDEVDETVSRATEHAIRNTDPIAMMSECDWSWKVST